MNRFEKMVREEERKSEQERAGMPTRAEMVGTRTQAPDPKKPEPIVEKPKQKRMHDASGYDAKVVAYIQGKGGQVGLSELTKSFNKNAWNSVNRLIKSGKAEKSATKPYIVKIK